VSELREDPVSGRLVLLAPGRAARPHTVAPPATPTAMPGCPFCPGNEHETPPERCRTGDGEPDTPGWRVRVVPNLYPIVGGESPGPGGGGAHEVVILDPDHSCDLARLDDRRVEEVFMVLRARARVHADAGLAHVQVLVNHGRNAGASIAHPHAQVLAVEFVPPLVEAAVTRVARQGRDLLWDDASASIDQGGRVVDGPAVAWAPWAGASPYEIRVAARDAGPRFEHAPDGALVAVGRVTRDVVAALGRILGDVAYNVVVHNAPASADAAPYHWYVTIVPRVAIVAGFELGTGVFVNTVDPANAAGQVRAVIRAAAEEAAP